MSDECSIGLLSREEKDIKISILKKTQNATIFDIFSDIDRYFQFITDKVSIRIF